MDQADEKRLSRLQKVRTANDRLDEARNHLANVACEEVPNEHCSVVVDGGALTDRFDDGREGFVLAASWVTFVLEPIARSMSAAFSAGASFTPLPVIATTW
jgi:hypothetical protein